jgi:hypothetical protein
VEHTDRTPIAPLSESEAAAEARRIIAEVYRPEPIHPGTYYRDTTPVPAIGLAAPVPQPDSRVVPEWAAGVAVASIGVGLGSFALGGGIWLVLEGLSSVTLLGVLATIAPFAGLAALATAIGSAVSKARSGSTTHIYQAPVAVTRRTEVTTNSRGMFSRSRTELHES